MTCEHCPSPAACKCPQTPAICQTGACKCGPDCPCAAGEVEPDSSGCLGGPGRIWIRAWTPFLLFLVFLGLIGGVLGIAGNSMVITLVWPWVGLLAVAILALVAMIYVVRMAVLALVGGGDEPGQAVVAEAEPESPAPAPAEPPGCGPWYLIGGLALLAVGLAMIAMVWLVTDGEGSAGLLTLFPLAIVVLVGGLVGWWYGRTVWEPKHGSVAEATLIGTFLYVLLVAMVVGLLVWLVDATDAEPENERVLVVLPESSSTTTTTAAPEPEPEPEPTGTPLSPAAQALLEKYCATVDGVPASQLTMEQFLLEPELQTGPADGESPARAPNPPPGLDIEYTGIAEGGCGDQLQVVVVAELGGPPGDVQISMSISIEGVPGAEPDPAAPGAIGRNGGWSTLVTVDGFQVMQFDPNFNPEAATALYDENENVIVIVSDAPSDAEEVEYLIQTFYRDGNTEESDIAYVAAPMRFSF